MRQAWHTRRNYKSISPLCLVSVFLGINIVIMILKNINRTTRTKWQNIDHKLWWVEWEQVQGSLKWLKACSGWHSSQWHSIIKCTERERIKWIKHHSCRCSYKFAAFRINQRINCSAWPYKSRDLAGLLLNKLHLWFLLFGSSEKLNWTLETMWRTDQIKQSMASRWYEQHPISVSVSAIHRWLCVAVKIYW